MRTVTAEVDRAVEENKSSITSRILTAIKVIPPIYVLDKLGTFGSGVKESISRLNGTWLVGNRTLSLVKSKWFSVEGGPQQVLWTIDEKKAQELDDAFNALVAATNRAQDEMTRTIKLPETQISQMADSFFRGTLSQVDKLSALLDAILKALGKAAEVAASMPGWVLVASAVGVALVFAVGWLRK